MQGNATQLRSGGFVGANVAVAKDLARIHRDQLAVEPLGDADGQLGLAARRRSDDCHHAQLGYGRLNKRLNWSSGRIRVVGRPCGQLIGSSVAASELSSWRADSGVIASPKRTALWHASIAAVSRQRRQPRANVSPLCALGPPRFLALDPLPSLWERARMRARLPQLEQRSTGCRLQLVDRALPKGAVAGALDCPEDGALVAKADLTLGGMNVDVDLGGIHPQVEYREREPIGLAQPQVGLLNSKGQVAVVDATPVEQDHDVPATGPVQRRRTDQTGHDSIVERANLARGVPQKRERQVDRGHPLAVVDNLDQALPGGLDPHLDP